MCGLVSCFGQKEDLEYLKTARNKMFHRGPDEKGIFLDQSNEVGLAHRRLSIIDVEKGGQPLTREEATVIFNGEIYNYLELRKELKNRGYNFITDSDTEVLVQAYREWGENCLEKFRGMFAFVIWDRKKEVMFLARDRLGQKPLFYASKENKISIASEIQALLEFPWVSRKLNKCVLPEYLALNRISSPDSGFQDIKKVKPGHYLLCKAGEIVEYNRYWDLNFKKDNSLDFNTAKQQLYKLLSEATRIRLRSDVPLGAFLSGGIDSSLMVGLMSEMLSDPVETFNISFENTNFDESSQARMISEKFNTNHHEFRLKSEFTGILPELVKNYGEPLADSSLIPTYYVARETSSRVKVALSGDGGDELFGGYNRYPPMAKAAKGLLTQIFFSGSVVSEAFCSMVRSLPRNITRPELLDRIYSFCQNMSGDLAYVYSANHASLQSRTLICRLLKKINRFQPENRLVELFSKYSEIDSSTERSMAVDTFSYLPDDILAKVDTATMANSLECRSPFLDHKVAEFAASLPVEFKINNNTKKYILKETFRDLLPDKIINRSKQGFIFPFAAWFRGPLEKYIKERLLSSHPEFYQIVDRKVLIDVINEHCELKNNHGWLLWNLLVLRIWMEELDVQV